MNDVEETIKRVVDYEGNCFRCSDRPFYDCAY